MLNREFLIEQAGGDEALVPHLITLFLDQSPRLVQEMRAALASSASRALHVAAHTLTGSLGVIGAEEAIPLGRLLTQKGRSGNFEGADELFAQLTKCLDALYIELNEIRAEFRQAAALQVKQELLHHPRGGQ